MIKCKVAKVALAISGAVSLSIVVVVIVHTTIVAPMDMRIPLFTTVEVAKTVFGTLGVALYASVLALVLESGW